MVRAVRACSLSWLVMSLSQVMEQKNTGSSSLKSFTAAHSRLWEAGSRQNNLWEVASPQPRLHLTFLLPLPSDLTQYFQVCRKIKLGQARQPLAPPGHSPF